MGSFGIEALFTLLVFVVALAVLVGLFIRVVRWISGPGRQ